MFYKFYNKFKDRILKFGCTCKNIDNNYTKLLLNNTCNNNLIIRVNVNTTKWDLQCNCKRSPFSNTFLHEEMISSSPATNWLNFKSSNPIALFAYSNCSLDCGHYCEYLVFASMKLRAPTCSLNSVYAYFYYEHVYCWNLTRNRLNQLSHQT